MEIKKTPLKASRKIKKKKKKKKNYKKETIKIKYNSKSLILMIIRLQDKFIPKFNFWIIFD